MASRGGIRDVNKLRVSMSSYGLTYLLGSTNGHYGYISSFDVNTLVAMCRMGGYPWSNTTSLSIRLNTTWSQSTSVWANMRCPYNSSSFENCWHDHPEVESMPTPRLHCFLPDLPSSGYQWRIVNGSVPSAGRLEMRPTALHESGAQ